jgi:hypothetical protein
MALIRAIHAQCDVCGYTRRDMDTGTWQWGNPRQEHVVYKMRGVGWSHGKRDICPYCRKLRTTAVPDEEQRLYRLRAARYIQQCEAAHFERLLASIVADADEPIVGYILEAGEPQVVFWEPDPPLPPTS